MDKETNAEGCLWIIVFLVGLTIFGGPGFWAAVFSLSTVAVNILFYGILAITIAMVLIQLTKL